MSLLKLGGIGAILWLIGSLVGLASGFVVQQPDPYALLTGQGFGEGFVNSMVLSLNLTAAADVLLGLGTLLIFLATLELRKRYKSTLALVAGIFGLLTALSYFGLAAVIAISAPQLAAALSNPLALASGAGIGEALAPLLLLGGVAVGTVVLFLVFTILLGVTFLTKRKEMGGSLPLVTGIFLILAIIPLVVIITAILLIITFFTLPSGPAPKAPKKGK